MDVVFGPGFGLLFLVLGSPTIGIGLIGGILIAAVGVQDAEAKRRWIRALAVIFVVWVIASALLPVLLGVAFMGGLED